jgi:hypothetical protein
MSGRMDWRRARLAGKRALDLRFENDVPDTAARWLRKAEARRRERRTLTAPSPAIGASRQFFTMTRMPCHRVIRAARQRATAAR